MYEATYIQKTLIERQVIANIINYLCTYLAN